MAGKNLFHQLCKNLKQARARIDAYTKETGREIYLEVDGGVNAMNIAEIARAGADTFVAGNAIFTQGKDTDKNRYNTIVSELRASLATV